MPEDTRKAARILIVDDQEANVRLLESMLRQAAGYTSLRSTTDPRAVFDLYAEFQPDLILLDLHMPGLDGFAVMHRLKSLIPANTFLPVLVLTADITPEVKRRALSSGASDFLSKPFDQTEVLLRIKNLLETRSLHRQLREQNALLEEKVVERTRALEEAHVELLGIVKALEQSNAELNQFAYVASHDLQEPLRMVASYVELVARRYKGRLDPEADEFIAFAVDGVTRMRELLGDILTFSRVHTRGQPFAPTDCGAILDHTIASLQSVIAESSATIVHDPLPVVVGDASQLGQLFQNLLSNAIKFRREEPPRVTVAARREGGEWVFSIRDNGIGIDPQDADRIFALFQRLHARSEYPGTGMGLAICKKIVERHGGRIWVESQPGQGATFSFTIPDGEKATPAFEPAGSGTAGHTHAGG